MDYALNIRDHNKQAHIDIENDIQSQKNGLFTFTVRIAGGNIVDYNLTEYVPASKYLRLKGIFIQELTIAHHTGERSGADTVRADNIQHRTQGWSGPAADIEHRQEQKKALRE